MQGAVGFPGAHVAWNRRCIGISLGLRDALAFILQVLSLCPSSPHPADIPYRPACLSSALLTLTGATASRLILVTPDAAELGCRYVPDAFRLPVASLPCIHLLTFLVSARHADALRSVLMMNISTRNLGLRITAVCS
jgi:hypothetical protein